MNPPSESRRELDSTVVNIELTLGSIIQGVERFFLTDNARVSMSGRHWENFLHVAAGLCVIFIFWSRSIVHTRSILSTRIDLATARVRSAGGLAIEVKHDKGDSEQRLEDPLQHI